MRIWDITVDDESGQSKTIRGLTHAQTIDLMEIFSRNGITAKAVEYDGFRTLTGKTESVTPDN